MKKLFPLILGLILCSTGFSQSKPRPLFDNTTLGEIRLDLGAEKWWDVLDSLRLYGEGMLPAKVQIDGSTFDAGSVRFRGNASYQLGYKRNPFHIKLGKAADYQGVTSLKLSSSLRDPSMVREALFLEIASKYIPVPRYSYCKLYVNGKYNGVFLNIESVDASFLQNNFGSSGNAFFKAGVDYPLDKVEKGCNQGIFSSMEFEENIACYYNNFENKNETDWKELQELTRIVSKDPKNAAKVLDVDNVLWMLALNNVMVNLNSYIGKNSQNFYLYKNDAGQFSMIPWDLNLAFGSAKNTGNGSDLALKDLQRLDPMLHADNPYKPLVSALLADPLNRKIYLSHIRQIFTENFKNGWYEKRARELQGMIVVPFSEDPNKTYSLDEFQTSLVATIGKRSQIPGIVELMSKRVKYLQNFPEMTALPSVVTEVKLKEREKFEREQVKSFQIEATADRFPKRLVLYYRPEGKPFTPFQMLTMNETKDPSAAAGLKRFEVSVPMVEGMTAMEYYIMSENAGTVSFSPENYSKRPSTISLAEINK